VLTQPIGIFPGSISDIDVTDRLLPRVDVGQSPLIDVACEYGTKARRLWVEQRINGPPVAGVTAGKDVRDADLVQELVHYVHVKELILHYRDFEAAKILHRQTLARSCSKVAAVPVHRKKDGVKYDSIDCQAAQQSPRNLKSDIHIQYPMPRVATPTEQMCLVARAQRQPPARMVENYDRTHTQLRARLEAYILNNRYQAALTSAIAPLPGDQSLPGRSEDKMQY
jgi:hypothetical protein